MPTSFEPVFKRLRGLLQADQATSAIAQALFQELDTIAAESLTASKKAAFVANAPVA